MVSVSDLARLALRVAEARWVTIGAKAGKNTGGKKKGGVPVQIDDSGKIVKGPAKMTGKKPSELKKDKPAANPEQHKAPDEKPQLKAFNPDGDGPSEPPKIDKPKSDGPGKPEKGDVVKAPDGQTGILHGEGPDGKVGVHSLSGKFLGHYHPHHLKVVAKPNPGAEKRAPVFYGAPKAGEEPPKGDLDNIASYQSGPTKPKDEPAPPPPEISQPKSASFDDYRKEKGVKHYTVDHSLLSPSGKVSGRSATAAQARVDKQFYDYNQAEKDYQTKVDSGEIVDPSGKYKQVDKSKADKGKADQLRQKAKDLRALAARGMQPRKLAKHAQELEKEADSIDPPPGVVPQQPPPPPAIPSAPPESPRERKANRQAVQQANVLLRDHGDKILAHYAAKMGIEPKEVKRRLAKMKAELPPKEFLAAMWQGLGRAEKSADTPASPPPPPAIGAGPVEAPKIEGPKDGRSKSAIRDEAVSAWGNHHVSTFEPARKQMQAADDAVRKIEIAYNSWKLKKTPLNKLLSDFGAKSKEEFKAIYDQKWKEKEAATATFEKAKAELQRLEAAKNQAVLDAQKEYDQKKGNK